VFAALAAKHTTPGKVAFAKVDVDAAQAVAQQFAVTAMPTFLVLTNGRETARVLGADAAGLTTAVTSAVRTAKPSVTGGGVKLGGAAKPVFVRNGSLADTAPLGHRVARWADAVVRFVVLYVVSLFSIDALRAAEGSRFSVRGGGGGGSGGGGGGGPGGPGGRRLGSIDSVRRTNAACAGGSCG